MCPGNQLIVVAVGMNHVIGGNGGEKVDRIEGVGRTRTIAGRRLQRVLSRPWIRVSAWSGLKEEV
jgi:hypothetical protein